MVKTKFYIRQTNIIFRHGDRSPITSLKDTQFWENQIAEQKDVMRGFNIRREEGDEKHTMEGNPPFGMLTKKGVAGIQAKGEQFRKDILSNGGTIDSSYISCRSSNFNRTIGSAQNFLIGLGIGINDKNIAIDTRCWRNMIPDGDYHEFHEFLSQYQTELHEYSKDNFADIHQNVVDKLLKSGICGFKIGPDGNSVPGGINLDRLCEILICLNTYNQLGKTGITIEEYKSILSIKEKWCYAFSKIPKIIQSTMAPFLYNIMNPIREIVQKNEYVGGKMQINIFSGHDSTLYTTLNAFNLRPIGLSDRENKNMSWCSSMWPTYSDTLRIDVLEKIDVENNRASSSHQQQQFFPIVESDSVDNDKNDHKTKFYVRFTYGNGNHPAITPFGEKYLIIPAKKFKFIWETNDSIEEFFNQTSVHANETNMIFQEFSICKRKGFLGLPSGDPIFSFPNNEFKIWDKLVDEIPSLLTQNSSYFRKKIYDMKILNHTELKTKAELRRGYLLLSVLANTFLFGFEEEDPPSKIPKSIAIPLCGIAERLKIVPALIHASICLYNYKKVNQNEGYNVDNFDTIVDFIGSKDEKWFFLVTADIEFQGSKMLAPAVYLTKALHAATVLLDEINNNNNNNNKIINKEFNNTKKLLELWIPYVTFQLYLIEDAIRKMIRSFKRMKEGCNPSIFYNYIRPFLAGSKGNPSMPDGVIYDGVFDNKPQMFSGGSAAQSTLFPVLDAIFNINHAKIPGPNSFLKEMQRFYMPHEHNNFVLYLLKNHKNNSITEFISKIDSLNTMTKNSNGFKHTYSMLKTRYNFCIASLTNFRSTHINIVASYIISQAAKVRKSESSSSSSSSSMSSNKKRKLHEAAGGKGTGGSDLMEFLKPIRDNTKAHNV